MREALFRCVPVAHFFIVGGSEMGFSFLSQAKMQYDSLNNSILKICDYPIIKSIYPNICQIAHSILCADIVEFLVKLASVSTISQNETDLVNFICDQNFTVEDLEIIAERMAECDPTQIPFSILLLSSAENHFLRNRFWKNTIVNEELNLLKTLANALANINGQVDDTIITHSNRYIEHIGKYALSKLNHLFGY